VAVTAVAWGLAARSLLGVATPAFSLDLRVDILAISVVRNLLG
jgi:hypothetical protein